MPNLNHRRGPWSQDEDRRLLQLVHQNGPSNWVRIAQQIQSRSPKQCRERYHQNLKAGLDHGPITAEEGRLIEHYVNTMGKRWAEIARRIPGRSDNAVKNWWNGGQNRRKRQGTRSSGNDSNIQRPAQQANHVPQFTHSMSYLPRLGNGVLLPPPFALPTQSVSYDQSTTLNSMQLFSHRSMYGSKGPPAQFDFGNCPPKSLYSTSFNNNNYPTPLHSPSVQSNQSADTPSLVSDTSSINVSPNGSFARHPMSFGNRDERRSSIPYMPQHPTGFLHASGTFDAYSRPDFNKPIPYCNNDHFRTPGWVPNRPTQPSFASGGSEIAYGSAPNYANDMPPPSQGMLGSQAPSPSPPGIKMAKLLNDESEGKISRAKQRQPSRPVSPTSHSSPPKDSRMDVNRFT